VLHVIFPVDIKISGGIVLEKSDQKRDKIKGDFTHVTQFGDLNICARKYPYQHRVAPSVAELKKKPSKFRRFSVIPEGV